MPASHKPRCRSLIAVMAAVALLAVAGCASQSTGHASVSQGQRDVLSQPVDVNQSLLKPAVDALEKASAAHAEKFAPQIVASARQRITLARGILFAAAKQGRPINEAERNHIQTLVRQAKLDARAALVKTQAGAVEYQIHRLHSATSSLGQNKHNPNGHGAGVPNAPPGDNSQQPMEGM